jgi:hypothetical protein
MVHEYFQFQNITKKWTANGKRLCVVNIGEATRRKQVLLSIITQYEKVALV